MPTIKGSTMPDSCMPLLRLMVPALLVAPGEDPECPLVALRSALRVAGSPDVRLVVVEVRGWRAGSRRPRPRTSRLCARQPKPRMATHPRPSPHPTPPRASVRASRRPARPPPAPRPT
jgi:hypothetical protein